MIKHLLVRRGIYLLLLFSVCIAAAGCGTRNRNIADPLHQSSTDGEVDMAALKQITDDSGTPLTDTELRILAAPTGELDRNLSPSEMRDVALQYKYFLRKFRPSMERFVQRSENYLAYSRKVFREHGLPEDLAYLAIVESGYNAQATSPSGAAGVWQFMPFTGARYGLDQNWWHDERRDSYKSTEAAASYLKKLYGDFKDWHLAIAAYNAGEGKIGRALGASNTKNFSDLKLKNHTLDEKTKIRDETRQYVPRFIAVCKIMRNLGPLGFTPINPESKPEKVAMQVPPGTDLLALSQNIRSNWGEFSANNPSFKRYVSSPNKESQIYLPREQSDAAIEFLRRPESGSSGGWYSYNVSPKEDWDKISRKCNVPAEALRDANRSKKLVAGTTIRVPSSFGQNQPDYITAQAKRSQKGASSAQDSQARAIALAKSIQATPSAQAAKERDLGPSGSLGSGSIGKGSATSKAEAKNTVHVIQPGDTYWSVARKYSINPKDLIRLNGDQSLKPGSTLVLAE